MTRASHVLGGILRLLPLLAVLAISVSGSGLQPTTLSLTKLHTADGYDMGDDVVWVLVLGEDDLGHTDAIQLLGIDVRTGAAAAIGFPRDTWVELGEGAGSGKINQAHDVGGPALASAVVADLGGISPDYVLVTAGEGFVPMVDALGGVTVESARAVRPDDDRLRVRRGPNRFTGSEALEFAETRLAFPGPGDFVRSRNHQALLLGLLMRLQLKDDQRGFVEMMAMSALDGLDTNASPVDLYRLLNVLTGVDTARVQGCVLVGAEDVDERGNQIILADRDLAERLGKEAASDATFESGCRPD